MKEEIARWEHAAHTAPTNEDLARLEQSIAAAQELVEEAERNYRIAVVQKACIWGWTVIADDLGVSAKLLHNWHARYCPEMEDLSSIPAKVEARNEAAAKRAEAKARRAAEAAAEMQRLAEELRAKKANLHAVAY